MRARITGGEALQAPTSLPQSQAQSRCTVPSLSGVPELERGAIVRGCQKVSITGRDGENADSECDLGLPLSKFPTTHSSHKRHATRRVFYHPLRPFRNFRAARFFTPPIHVKIIPHAHRHQKISRPVTPWPFKGRSEVRHW
jgi:hypothetical protein